jgi:hypothetical protein
MILLRPVKPRASRIALIVASVPDDTSRTFSMLGTSFDDQFGDLEFGLGGRAERQAAGGGFLHRLDRAGMGVAENGRPPRADVVDVFAAVGVPYARTRGAAEEHRGAADAAEGAHRRIDPAGDDRSRQSVTVGAERPTRATVWPLVPAVAQLGSPGRFLLVAHEQLLERVYARTLRPGHARSSSRPVDGIGEWL